MIVDSRRLFQQLLRDFTTDDSRTEKEAILLWLLESKFALSRAEIMAGKKVRVDQSLLNGFIHRLNKNEPLQYILEEAEFYGRKFRVGPAVLIPRPETELLVKMVVDHFQGNKQEITLLDIGTGSGCIAITLALELPFATVLATDISSDALGIAKENAKRLTANVQFQIQDILNDTLSMGQLDAVVSNPPYILENERILLQKKVVEYEPAQALFVPDSNPLLFHQAIAKKARQSLKPGGLLLTEINERLGNDMAALFESLGYADVKIHKDLCGKDRLVSGMTNYE